MLAAESYSPSPVKLESMLSRFVLPTLLLTWNALILILWTRNFHASPQQLFSSFSLMFQTRHFSAGMLFANWSHFLQALLAVSGLLAFSLLAGQRARLLLPHALWRGKGIIPQFALGLGLLAGTILALGLNGLLFNPRPGVSLVLLLVPLMLAVKTLRREAKNPALSLRGLVSGPPVLGVKIMIALAAIMATAGVFSIEVGWDALMYHLRLPSFYIYNHKIYDVWHNYCSAFPANIEILYTLCMLAEGETTARLLNTAFGLLLLGAGHRLARETGLAGRWTVLLLGSCPLFVVLTTRAYIDLGFAFFTTVSLIHLVRWWKNGSRMELVFSGLAAGWGAGSKYVAAVYLGSALIVLTGKPRLASKLKASLLWGFPALLAYAPWLAKNALLRGNPVDPFLGALFGNTGAVPPEIKPFFEDGASFVALLSSLPARTEALFLNHGHIFGPLNPALAGLLPLVLFAPARGFLAPVKRLVVAYTILWFLMTYDVRYYLPALPALCVLTEALITCSLTGGRALKTAPRMLAETGMFLGLAYGSAVILLASLPFSQPLGFADTEVKLRQGLTPPPYASFTRTYVNSVLPKSARILYICQHSTWYLDRECIADFHYWESNLTRIISTGRNEEGIAKRFRQLGVGWILSTMGRAEMYAKIPGYFAVPPGGWEQFKSFLSRRCETAWQTDFQVVYRIGRPHAPRPIPCLPVFEDLYFGEPDTALRKDLPADALRGYSRPHPLLRDVGSTFMRRGTARLMLGDFVAAEGEFQRAESAGMDNPDVHLGHAVVLFNQGRISDALPHVLRVIEMDPSSARAYELLARIRKSMN